MSTTTNTTNTTTNQPKRKFRPRIKTKTIVKKVLVKSKPKPVKVDDGFDAQLAKYFRNVQSVVSFPILIYLGLVFALYTDTVNNPNDNSLKTLLTYLSKYQFLSGIVDYFAKYPTKFFSVLVFGVILISSRKSQNYFWFFGMSITALVMRDQPILLYLLQSVSVLIYMRNKTRNMITTFMCILPLLYYYLAIHNVPTTASLNDPKDPYDNYTLPSIILNTTQSPILTRTIKDTSV